MTSGSGGTPYPPGTVLGIRDPLYGLTYAEVVQYYREPSERGGHYLTYTEALGGVWLLEFGDNAKAEWEQ